MSEAGFATFNTNVQVGTRGTGVSALTLNTAYGDGLLFDFYADASPYLRHASIAAVSANTAAAQLEFYTTPASNGSQLALTLDSSQNATFAGAVTRNHFLTAYPFLHWMPLNSMYTHDVSGNR